MSENNAAELRRAFDHSFALPPPPSSAELENLLTIRVAGDPYAIPLRDIAGVVAGRRVVPVPAATVDLLGLAGIRGGIVPVFALASILGYGQAPDSPRWMVLCGEEDPIALAFSEFEGYVRVPRTCLHADDNLQYVNQVARTDGGVRPVIGIDLVLATIRKRGGHDRLAKEQ